MSEGDYLKKVHETRQDLEALYLTKLKQLKDFAIGILTEKPDLRAIWVLREGS
jgi:hypothetical protein